MSCSLGCRADELHAAGKRLGPHKRKCPALLPAPASLASAATATSAATFAAALAMSLRVGYACCLCGKRMAAVSGAKPRHHPPQHTLALTALPYVDLPALLWRRC